MVLVFSFLRITAVSREETGRLLAREDPLGDAVERSLEQTERHLSSAKLPVWSASSFSRGAVQGLEGDSRCPRRARRRALCCCFVVVLLFGFVFFFLLCFFHRPKNEPSKDEDGWGFQEGFV